MVFPARFRLTRVLLLIERQISRLLIGCFFKRRSDWFDFRHFPGYQIKIESICRLTKREDQALISVSTAKQELPAQNLKFEISIGSQRYRDL